MMHKVKVTLRSDFVRSVSKLGSGTIVAQIIAFATIPLLTRTYSQEAFGLLAAFVAVVGIISSFATLKYDTAIVLPKDDKDAYALLKLSNIVTLAITTACVAIMFVPLDIFNEYQGLQLLIGVGVLLSVNFNNSALWNIRYRCFNQAAISKIVQVVSIFICQYVCYLFFELKGLIVGNVLGMFFTGVYLLLSRKIDWQLYRKISTLDMAGQGRRYVDFPKYFTASSAILSFSSSLPVLIFVKYIPLAQVGIYGVAVQIISQPVTLVANSIRSVILVDMAERKNNNRPVLGWYVKLLIGLFILSAGASVCLLLLGDLIITTFLGREWADASSYAKMLIPLLIGLMIASPGTAAVRVFEMLKYNFVYSIISLAFKLIVLLALFSQGDINFEHIILVYAVLSLMLIIAHNIYILAKIKKYEKSI